MARSHARLTVAGSALAARPDHRATRLAELFAPLDRLLCDGGDERLTILPDSKSNIYGCRPRPRSDAIALSSSTATSISWRAYQHARSAQERLIEDAAAMGLFEAFEMRTEQMRHALRMHLALEGSGAEIVFSPSGTDSQLHALFFAKLFLGSPVTSIVAGSDQTGSGTVFTASARHFAHRTARGKSVTKGAPIAGWSDDIDTLGIGFVAPDGAVRSGAEMDDLTIAAVSGEIAKGRKVVLQAMNASKFGWRAPSDACLAAIGAQWPQSVQIVIDACQMRIGRVRIGEYLKRDYLVLLTGSKFFTGPPFSGTALIPRRMSDKFAALDRLPQGLFDYADRSDLPFHWPSIRCELALEPNFGQWLRWEAALEEMRSYYALPGSYRCAVMAGLADAIPDVIRSSCALEFYPAPANPEAGVTDDEEFGVPTIFPFLVRSPEGYLDKDSIAEMYRALNRDLASELNGLADGEIGIASRPCHIGQSVEVRLPGGTKAAALRIAIGSRTLVESWSGSENAAERAIRTVMEDVRTAICKIELLLKHHPFHGGKNGV